MSAIDEMYKKYEVDICNGCTYVQEHPYTAQAICEFDFSPKRCIFPRGDELFTAEKQLELIKMLLKNVTFKLNPFIEYERNSGDSWRYIHTNLTFAEALAEIITNYSTILDNQKVKEILER